MSGILLKTARSGILAKSCQTGILNFHRSLPLSCTNFEPFKIEKIDTDHKHGMLKVKWEDGIEGQYPYVWLQDCAPPPGWNQNYLGTDSRPLPLLAELSLATKPETVEVLPIGQGIMIQWPPYNRVNYPSSWLRQHFRKESGEAEPELAKIWDRKTVEEMNGVPTFEATANISKYFGEIRKSYEEFGIVRIRNGMDAREAISGGLGIQEENKIPISAMCFTKQVNDLHTGVPFCDPIPNLAVLGFPKTPTSGQLQVVDGFMVAKRIRTENPFAFRYLCTTKINYGNLDRRCEFETASFDNLINRHNREPVFILKDDGIHVDKVVFSNPCRSSRQEIPPITMHEFYAALKLFNNMAYDAKNLVNIEAEGGDLVLIANDRILHGTTAFAGNPDSQHIQESFYYWE